MTRLHHVKKARKDYPAAGIEKGDPYFWWKFRYGPKHRSKTRPPRSALTQSEFFSQAWDIEDRIDEIGDLGTPSLEDLGAEVQSIVDEIRQLGEEQEEKIYNMPDSLQDSPSAELLQGRADECEEWATNIESLDLDVEARDTSESDLDDLVNEIQQYKYEGE